MLRRTPCVGICSTTYGDLVCRGCKRFAHEIVQWNAFDAAQRQAVWQRLLELRAGAVGQVLRIADEERLRTRAGELALAPADDADMANLAYEVLQRVRWREEGRSFSELGLALVRVEGETPTAGDGPEPAEVLMRIDQEFYQRSKAWYERNFRIPAQ